MSTGRRRIGPLDVRRLTAVDMVGGAGTDLRRRLITGEFVGGAIFGPLLGLAAAASAGDSTWQLFGWWLTGACLNYVPLAVHALTLLPRGRLAAELAGVDIGRELRIYTAKQFWIVVPLLLVVLALLQLIPLRSTPRSPDVGS